MLLGVVLGDSSMLTKRWMTYTSRGRCCLDDNSVELMQLDGRDERGVEERKNNCVLIENQVGVYDVCVEI
jgi:hypothetical protein